MPINDLVKRVAKGSLLSLINSKGSLTHWLVFAAALRNSNGMLDDKKTRALDELDIKLKFIVGNKNIRCLLVARYSWKTMLDWL